MVENEEMWANGDEGAPFVVGIGASAGGLEAIERFFRALPPAGNVSFILVQHLSPDFRSFMSELLARYTPMPVHTVFDGLQLAAGAVYVLPPGKEVWFGGGRLRLRALPPRPSSHQAISAFFGTLAQEFGDRVAAVVLSGAGTDGSLGVKAIHDAGGLVLVQDDQTAKFASMPTSAAATGVADHVLAPEQMPEVILDHLRHLAAQSGERPLRGAPDLVAQLYEQLSKSQGVDFTAYRQNTLARRITRRAMSLGYHTTDEYLIRAISDSTEQEALLQDFLIGVTDFFRDPGAFETLRLLAVPALLEAVPPAQDLRVWVPACSTGEEAYSLAILLLEALELAKRPPNLKVFATDVNPKALQTASEGLYPNSALDGMPANLATKYFVKEGEAHVRIAPAVRRTILFSQHNLLRDPPFTRVDLLSCRNLLIYLSAAAQARVLGAAYFGLRREGVLFLGPSESLGEVAPEFEVLSSERRLYRKLTERRLSQAPLPSPQPFAITRGLVATQTLGSAPPGGRMQRAYDQLLKRFMPAGMLLDDERRVVHLFGDAHRYLQPLEGRVNLDLAQMVAPSLKAALLSSMLLVTREQRKVVCGHVLVPTEAGEATVELSLEPLHDKQGPPLYLLLFTPTDAAQPERDASTTPVSVSEELQERLQVLEHELAHTRESLQHTVEQLETANEELQSANEELHSANEELQATNEELHSVNEELYSVNEDHEKKIVELDRIASNLRKLMLETDMGMVFTDAEGAVTLYTPQATGLFNLLPQDVGRPLEHITSRLPADDVLDVVRRVRTTGEAEERRVRGPDGRVFLRRIKAYRNLEAAAGVLIAFIDVSALDRAETELRAMNTDLERRVLERGHELARSAMRLAFVAEHASDGYFDHDVTNGVVATSASMQRLLSVSSAIGIHELLELVHPEDRSELVAATESVKEQGGRVAAQFRIRTNAQWRWVRLRGAWLDEGSTGYHLVGTFTDIDPVKRTEAELKALAESLERKVAERTAAVAEREELLRTLIESLPDGLLVVDEQGRIELGNQGAADLFGVPRDRLIDVSSLVPAGAQSSHREHVTAFVQGGTAPQWMGQRTIETYRADGQRLLLDIALVPITFRGNRRALARVIDVSVARAADLAQRRLAAIVENSDDAIVGLTLEGQITSWNRGAERLLGYSATEAIGRSVALLFPGSLADEELVILARLREGKRVETFETVRVAKGGTSVEVSVTVSPVRDHDGAVVGASKIIRDVGPRKRMERSLISASHRLELATKAADVGIWQWDLRDDTLEWDLRMLEIHQVPEEARRGKLPYDFWRGRFHPDDVARLEQELNAAKRGVKHLDTEFRIVLPTGATRYLQAAAVVEHDADSTPQRLVGIVRDLTLERQRELELLALKERYERLFASAPDAYFLLELSGGRITDCNVEAEVLLGATRDQIRGLTLADVSPPVQPDGTSSAPALAALLGRANAEGRVRYEWLQRRLDGSDFWAEVVMVLSSFEGRPVLLTTWKDITVRKRALAAQARLAAIVAGSKDAIVSKTLEGVITSWNGGAERLFGYTASEVEGKLITLLFPKHLLAEEARILARVRDNEQVEPFDTIRLHKNGTELHVSVSASPVRSDEGKVIGAATILRDISEARARAAELRRSNQELEQFAYVASHDLQEPLRMVANYTELLGRKYAGKLDATADQYIHYASDGARRMRSLVADLLAFSRVNSEGKTPAPSDSGKALARAIAALQAALKESGGTVEHGQLPRVMADETQLSQVFQNLIGNAIKFRSEAPPRVVVSAARERNFWRFSVADNGIGFDMKHAERIFQMFQRLHNREEFQGSGIGLAIVKRVVERHGGTISVESTPGRGTTFHFTFPAERARN